MSEMSSKLLTLHGIKTSMLCVEILEGVCSVECPCGWKAHYGYPWYSENLEFHYAHCPKAKNDI